MNGNSGSVLDNDRTANSSYKSSMVETTNNNGKLAS